MMIVKVKGLKIQPQQKAGFRFPNATLYQFPRGCKKALKLRNSEAEVKAQVVAEAEVDTF